MPCMVYCKSYDHRPSHGGVRFGEGSLSERDGGELAVWKPSIDLFRI